MVQVPGEIGKLSWVQYRHTDAAKAEELELTQLGAEMSFAKVYEAALRRWNQTSQ